MIAKYAGRTAAVLSLVAGLAAAAGAQTQTVNFEVKPINQFSITSTAVTLTITTATAGSDPTPVTDATSVWAVTTNQTNAKISANIPTDMPAGLMAALVMRLTDHLPIRRVVRRGAVLGLRASADQGSQVRTLTARRTFSRRR